MTFEYEQTICCVKFLKSFEAFWKTSHNLILLFHCRYIAVCTPFFRMKYNIKSIAYILPILIFAPVYNIPRFFELESITGGPYENTTLSCHDGDEKFEVENQFLIEHVIKTNESIWNKWGIQCIKNNLYSVDSLMLTETRKDKLYISVNIFLLSEPTNKPLWNVFIKFR